MQEPQVAEDPIVAVGARHASPVAVSAVKVGSDSVPMCLRRSGCKRTTPPDSTVHHFQATGETCLAPTDTPHPVLPRAGMGACPYITNHGHALATMGFPTSLPSPSERDTIADRLGGHYRWTSTRAKTQHAKAEAAKSEQRQREGRPTSGSPDVTTLRSGSTRRRR